MFCSAVALLVSAALVSSSSYMSSTGIILVGDSRTVGLEASVELDENTYVVAEVGKGYKWFKEEGIAAVEEIMEEHNDISNWQIVFNLGVNDLGNCEKYVSLYSELEDEWDNCEFFYLSVNPVNEKLCKTVSNDKIQEFNSEFSSNDNYIDSYGYILENINSRDGLHYGASNYKEIYSIVKEALDNGKETLWGSNSLNKTSLSRK